MFFYHGTFFDVFCHYNPKINKTTAVESFRQPLSVIISVLLSWRTSRPHSGEYYLGAPMPHMLGRVDFIGSPISVASLSWSSSLKSWNLALSLV